MASPSPSFPNAVPAELTLRALSGVPAIEPGDDLSQIVLSALTANGLILQSADIVVLAQKIVPKAEGRAVDLRDVRPSLQTRACPANLPLSY